MSIPQFHIPCHQITNWDSFHDTFARVFEFPAYYGRNLDAWIDCLSDQEAPFVVHLDDCQGLRQRCPEIFEALVCGISFLNWRSLEMGGEPLAFLAFVDA